MSEKNNWVDQLKKIPDWIKGAIGLIITIAGFIAAFRSDWYLYSTLLGFLLLISLLGTLTYIAFARNPSFFGNKGAFKFARYRRLALMGDFALIIFAFLIVNSSTGRRYVSYSFQGTPTTSPTATSTATPLTLTAPPTVAITAMSKRGLETPPENHGTIVAPDNTATLKPSISIAKIIREANPADKGAITISVWLSAEGDYYVDSVRIVHIRGGAKSIGKPSSAVYPDAVYSFPYTVGSDEIHALNPALQLSATDTREVYFTLGLVPTGSFPGGGGVVHAIIYYHSPAGKTGSLLLEEPPKDMVFLSKLINMDIMTDSRLVTTVVVTPNGLQRGYQEVESSDTVLEYTPLDLDDFVISYIEPYVQNPDHRLAGELLDTFFGLNSLPDKTPEINLGGRNKLNELLMQEDRFLAIANAIANRVNTGNLTYIDLCAGLANMPCKQALVNNWPNQFYETLDALVISHMIQPDETLGNFVLANITTFQSPANRYFRFADYAIFGLTAHPEGPWFEVLVSLAPYQQNACKALNLRKSMIDEDNYERVKAVCKP